MIGLKKWQIMESSTIDVWARGKRDRLFVSTKSTVLASWCVSPRQYRPNAISIQGLHDMQT